MKSFEASTLPVNFGVYPEEANRSDHDGALVGNLWTEKLQYEMHPSIYTNPEVFYEYEKTDILPIFNAEK